MSDDLIRRVAALEDRYAICELLAHYCSAVDHRDWTAVANLFSRDGRADLPGFGQATGRSEIRNLFSHIPDQVQQSWHMVSNEVIELTGDRARCRSSFDVPLVAGEEACFALGRYEDELVREDQGWRFAERRLRYFAFSPLHPSGWGQQRLPAEMSDADVLALPTP
jgi:3-phenylpropionate/cinnamic acid dioxygenase small subunit